MVTVIKWLTISFFFTWTKNKNNCIHVVPSNPEIIELKIITENWLLQISQDKNKKLEFLKHILTLDFTMKNYWIPVKPCYVTFKVLKDIYKIQKHCITPSF